MGGFDNDRIGRLEAATERLSQNVVGLSTSLAIVSEITTRQEEIEKRAARAEAKAVIAETSTSRVQEDLVSQEEERRRLRTMVVIGFAVVVGLLAYIRYESVQQISERNKVAYQVCENTNIRVETQAQIVERAHDKPDATLLRTQKTDCKKAYGPKNNPSFLGVG
jgi:regulator of replication initiation timing